MIREAFPAVAPATGRPGWQPCAGFPGRCSQDGNGAELRAPMLPRRWMLPVVGVRTPVSSRQGRLSGAVLADDAVDWRARAQVQWRAPGWHQGAGVSQQPQSAQARITAADQRLRLLMRGHRPANRSQEILEYGDRHGTPPAGSAIARKRRPATSAASPAPVPRITWRNGPMWGQRVGISHRPRASGTRLRAYSTGWEGSISISCPTRWDRSRTNIQRRQQLGQAQRKQGQQGQQQGQPASTSSMAASRQAQGWR